ncbi:MAG: carbamoyltransferase HypF, partial [Candidatus Bathyarchaeota archaeon]
MRAEIEVQGIIQGVGFRPFVYRTAVSRKLAGYVKNRGDASVEIVVEGPRAQIDRFLQELAAKKPPLASIHHISTTFHRATQDLTGFKIVESSRRKKLSGSVIPPDVSICNECLRELRTRGDPRHDYFFITCTNCGPRYTVIQQLPYDRAHTTMAEFPLCDACRSDYSSSADRRFHAQTVACPRCGPTAYLTDNRGHRKELKNPIREAGRLLKDGCIVAVKGYGGFHLATSAIRDEPVTRLRKTKFRDQKPFAVMGRDLDTVRTFAEVSPTEAATLSSHAKPIVVLDKRADCCLSPLIAPGLHNIGVMLPYTGLHHLLFDEVKDPAFVMTSANPSNEPIYFEDAKALEKLGTTVDYFLFHNRVIAQRCDDSVIRLHGSRVSFIRRSRGYAPSPIALSHEVDWCTVGVGAKENVTACILWRNRAFLSQFIGDVDNLETYQYLKSTIQHLLKLTNTRIDAVACDLHPQYATGHVAQE